MKRLISLTLALIFLCVGSSCASAESVNIMEFARRFYRACEIFETNPPTPTVGSGEKHGIIIADLVSVVCDEEHRVTEIVQVFDPNDSDAVLQAMSALVCLYMPADEMTLGKLMDAVDVVAASVADMSADLGDYRITNAVKIGESIMLTIELK